jgi:hypothetical protein
MKKTLLTLAIVAIATLGAPAQAKSTPAKGANGNWVSAKADDAGNNTFSFREFSFDGDNWNVKYTLYLDQAKTQPVFIFRGIGTYSVTGKSKKVKGAGEALFLFDKKTLTLLTDNADLINNLGFANCNLQKGVERDISETGCSFVAPLAVCNREYDLVKVAGKKLFLGARPADNNMCTLDKRPVALGDTLIRKE